MWKASRWAVRWPIPGSLASSAISRWIGCAYMRSAGRRGGPATSPAGRAARAAERRR